MPAVRCVKPWLAETWKIGRTPKDPMHLARDVPRQNVERANWHCLEGYDETREKRDGQKKKKKVVQFLSRI